MKAVATLATGVGVAALDGLAASRDTTAGRSWTTPGIGATGPLVLGWGWAPAVQVGSAVMGGAMLATGHESGRGPLLMGIGLMARGAALTLAQHRRTTPAKVQGYGIRAQGFAAPKRQIVRGPIGRSSNITSVG